MKGPRQMRTACRRPQELRCPYCNTPYRMIVGGGDLKVNFAHSPRQCKSCRRYSLVGGGPMPPFTAELLPVDWVPSEEGESIPEHEETDAPPEPAAGAPAASDGERAAD